MNSKNTPMTQNLHVELGNEDDDINDDCTVWTAINPETCLPEMVVPFDFYQSMENLYNEQCAELQDYKEAHELAKEALHAYGETIALLKLHNHELTAQLSAATGVSK